MEETRGSTPHRPPVNRTTAVRVLGLSVVATAIGIGLAGIGVGGADVGRQRDRLLDLHLRNDEFLNRVQIEPFELRDEFEQANRFRREECVARP